MNILILYYSGVGNTKMIANEYQRILAKDNDVTITNIELCKQGLLLDGYDALVIGFPTIHGTPAIPITEFIEAQYVNKTRIPTLLFTTCGLYSANTLRIFAKRCRKKNLIPIQSESYRCQATDGSLLAPKMEIWFKHEKGLRNRIEQDSNVFLERLAEPLRESIPRFKLYSIINYPNKIMGQYVYKPVVYIHKSHCIKCGKCIKNCPRLSYNVSEDEMPIYQKERCIHCYRCIHQCPQQALSLSKKRRPDRTLDKCDIQR